MCAWGYGQPCVAIGSSDGGPWRREGGFLLAGVRKALPSPGSLGRKTTDVKLIVVGLASLSGTFFILFSSFSLNLFPALSSSSFPEQTSGNSPWLPWGTGQQEPGIPKPD